MPKGIYPPIPTPFQNGEVAYDKLASNLQKWNRTGLSGYLVLGSNGEFVFLSEKEKIKILEVARKNIPSPLKMIAGTGCESTWETIQLTNQAAEIGADLALIITPSYFKSLMKSEEMMAHFRAIADASKIPVMIYNVPKFTGVNIEAETVAKLAEHPNIVGMKDSSADMPLFAQFIKQCPAGFDVMVGTASVLYTGLCLGAVGGIVAMANVAPQEAVEIQRLFDAGKLKEARDLQLKMLPVNAAVTVNNGVPGLKAAMDMVGYYGGDPRPPLLPPKPDVKEKIKGILQKAGLL
ncbi:MAG: dihydrodipicolinate synthase family protein [candidate division NC10 bacterium]|nr:dihydrodipicolinate synthase family protein [candidate division NC10 bacterium]